MITIYVVYLEYRNTQITQTAMENSIELAKTLYGRSGVHQMDTQILKTDGGNYVYRHLIAGNSRCDARVYNPITGEDRFLENRNTFHYLEKYMKVPFITIKEPLIGSGVAKKYESN